MPSVLWTVTILCCIHVLFAWGQLMVVMTNQLSLGQAALAAVGAYTAGMLTTAAGVNPWIAALAGMIFGAVVGLIVGIPALRLHGLYLALATLGLNFIVISYVTDARYLGGSSGIYHIKGVPSTAIVGITIVIGIALTFLMRSRFGLKLMATGADPTLAASRGIDTTRYKVLAFMMSSALSALGGALYAGYVTFTSPFYFTISLSVSIVLYVFLGGRTLTGSALGAIVLVSLPLVFKNVAGIFPSIYGLILIVSMIARPNGLLYHNMFLDLRNRYLANGESAGKEAVH